jgi:hypothetical protein
VGALLVGETTEVFGQDPTGAYWYVRNPDVENGFCWLWGEYATVTGDVQALPVYTPPPTPTPAPAFDAEYTGLDTCSGWYLEFKLTNSGQVPFRSLSISVLNHKNDETLSSSENRFINHDGCVETAVLNSLAPGEKIFVSSPTFNYDPSGDKLLATIRLCTEDDLKGTCVTRELEIKP